MGQRRRHHRQAPTGLARLWDSLTRALKRPAPPRTRKLRRKKVRVRGESPQLRFNVSGTWAWSLRVYEGSRLAGMMQAASPLTCVTVVAPYFNDGDEPRHPFRLFIRCNASRRQLKLDRQVYARLAGHSRDSADHEILRFLGDHFERDLGDLGDSTCVTVMMDGDGEVVDSAALLRRAFGLPAPPQPQSA